MREGDVLGFYDEDSWIALCASCAATAEEARQRIAREAPDFVDESLAIRTVGPGDAPDLLARGDVLTCDSCGAVIVARE